MDLSDEHEEKIANKIENIHELELEALRRAGVAKEKEQGLEIESTEAVRLFREATGYILRLRKLREDLQREDFDGDNHQRERAMGYVKDYNRILKDIQKNPSFESCIEEFGKIQHEKNEDGAIVRFEFESGSVELPPVFKDHETLNDLVVPRLIRLTKEVENSLIGRCTSGKRAD